MLCNVYCKHCKLGPTKRKTNPSAAYKYCKLVRHSTNGFSFSLKLRLALQKKYIEIVLDGSYLECC